MDYPQFIEKILQYFTQNNTTSITRKEISVLAGLDETEAYKKYTRPMIKDGLLDVGVSYYKRNDDVFKILHGYEVYITRYEDDQAISPISLAEWLTYIENDPEFRNDGYAECTNEIGEYVKMTKQGLAFWTSHKNNRNVWFDTCFGRIMVKNPDQATKIKMYKIAEYFNAVVEGEDGEQYDGEGQIIN